MNDYVFWIFCILVLAGQIFLSLKFKRLLVRLIPAVLSAASTALCFVFYAISNNWAWLIISIFTAAMIIPVFLGMLIVWIVRKIF